MFKVWSRLLGRAQLVGRWVGVRRVHGVQDEDSCKEYIGGGSLYHGLWIKSSVCGGTMGWNREEGERKQRGVA
jgi:hypothetical protein